MNKANDRNKGNLQSYAVNKKGVSYRKQGVMDENSICFQVFLILLSFIYSHLVQKAKFLYSSNVKAILRCLGFCCFLFFWGGGSNCTEAKFFQ